MAILAHLDWVLVAELVVLLEHVGSALPAEAVATAHAIVDWLVVLDTVVLVEALELTAAVWVLAGEGEVLGDPLLGTLVHLGCFGLREELLAPLHVLVVVLYFYLFLLREFAAVVQDEEVLGLVLRDVVNEWRLPIHLFHVFQLKCRAQVVAVA